MRFCHIHISTGNISVGDQHTKLDLHTLAEIRLAICIILSTFYDPVSAISDACPHLIESEKYPMGPLKPPTSRSLVESQTTPIRSRPNNIKVDSFQCVVDPILPPDRPTYSRRLFTHHAVRSHLFQCGRHVGCAERGGF